MTKGPNENHGAKNQRAHVHGLQRNGFPGGKAACLGNSQDLSSQVSGLCGKGKNYGRQLRRTYFSFQRRYATATDLSSRSRQSSRRQRKADLVGGPSPMSPVGTFRTSRDVRLEVRYARQGGHRPRRPGGETLSSRCPIPIPTHSPIATPSSARPTDTHRQRDPLHRWRNYRVAGASRATQT